ncbi:hypothetical protein [Enterovibrio norvegicus]|uniref:hypothetical protein n=1 Tax=Enterovibrio norvegicus TaxID=188144 RepID=UPI00352CD83D
MNERYLRALIKLTRASSAAVLDATIDHLAYGESQKAAAIKHGVQQEAVSRLSTRLQALDKQITDLSKLKNNS